MKRKCESELIKKAKEAKKRMKSGFWQTYGDRINEVREKARAEGINMSRVVEFYEGKNSNQVTIKQTTQDDFYEKVVNLLETEGEVSNAIWRLIDQEYYNTLDYENKQRHLFEISAKYRNAVERYKKEKATLKN